MTTTPGAIPSSHHIATSAGTPTEITTPDRVQTRLGTLEFTDGAPSPATVESVYDNLDFTHALNAFLTYFQGASIHALREGPESIGAPDGSVVIFPELMDSSSLLTANCDTVYAFTTLDLGEGPMIVEVPP